MGDGKFEVTLDIFFGLQVTRILELTIYLGREPHTVAAGNQVARLHC
jgi:hypothetical protein